MDEIVRLNAGQEAALQAAAEKFVEEHGGDVMKALKAMILLNGRLTEQLTRPVPNPRSPRTRSVGQRGRQTEFSL